MFKKGKKDERNGSASAIEPQVVEEEQPFPDAAEN